MLFILLNGGEREIKVDKTGHKKRGDVSDIIKGNVRWFL
jgi:hypothetical protein